MREMTALNLRDINPIPPDQDPSQPNDVEKPKTKAKAVRKFPRAVEPKEQSPVVVEPLGVAEISDNLKQKMQVTEQALVAPQSLAEEQTPELFNSVFHAELPALEDVSEDVVKELRDKLAKTSYLRWGERRSISREIKRLEKHIGDLKTWEVNRAEAERPKTLKEENDIARENYFQYIKNRKDPYYHSRSTAELLAREDIYKATKRKIIEGLLAKGEGGDQEVRDFLLKEVELKREATLAGSSSILEKNKARISKAIEVWDKWGVEQRDNSGNITKKGSIFARMTKMATSIAMTGLASGSLVKGLSQINIGSAAALSGGIMSSVGKKLMVGVGLGTLMEGIEMTPKRKKALRLAILAGSGVLAVASGGGIMAGVAMGASSAFGYGLSKLNRKYEKNISDRMELVKGYHLNLENIDQDTARIEKEMELALKSAETKRILGKVREVATAIGGSMATMEISGMAHDYQSSHHIEHKVEPAPERHEQASEPKPQVVQNDVELKPEHPAYVPEATHAVNQDAIVGEGHGIEHAFIKEIDHNPQLAKDLGFTGNINDKAELHSFAEHQAHIVAVKTGYIDPKGGEIRVIESGKVAYELKVENGHILVDEKTLDGKIMETHHEGDAFEKDLESYERNFKKAA